MHIQFSAFGTRHLMYFAPFILLALIVCAATGTKVPSFIYFGAAHWLPHFGTQPTSCWVAFLRYLSLWRQFFFLLDLSLLKMSKPYMNLLRHILTSARLIALNWEKRSPPSSDALYARIKDVEKITARIQDRMEAHNHVWEFWHLQEDPPWVRSPWWPSVSPRAP